jgi:hypothetical protein
LELLKIIALDERDLSTALDGFPLKFTREKIPLESPSFLVIIGLAVGFEVFPYQMDEVVLHAVDFFRGFGHEALVAVCALMIAGQGIVRTGALEPVGRVLTRF